MVKVLQRVDDVTTKHLYLFDTTFFKAAIRRLMFKFLKTTMYFNFSITLWVQICIDILFDRYCTISLIRKIPRRQIHILHCLLTHFPPLKSALYV